MPKLYHSINIKTPKPTHFVHDRVQSELVFCDYLWLRKVSESYGNLLPLVQ